MRLAVQMAACFSQIKNITVQSFRLFALTINRMLASLVLKRPKEQASLLTRRSSRSLRSLGQLRNAASRLLHCVIAP